MTMNTELPKAPSIAEAGLKIKGLMEQNPDQASQILLSLGAIKHAQEGYDQYCLIAENLDVKPASKEQWDAHDKTIFRPLIAASLTRNLPGMHFSEQDMEELISASEMESKTAAAKKIMEIIMRSLSANEEVAQSWTKLGLAALNLI